jgi:acyl-coenzyme A thioesterase PaaI-like protein
MSEKTVTIEQLQKLLSHEKAFTRPFGFHVESLGDGVCTLDVPFRPEWERPGSIVSGVVFMTAADVAMWLAIKTRSGLDDPSVTSHMQTAFLRSAKGHGFLCRATVLRSGRRTSYGVAECVTKEGVLLTHHTLTYVRPNGG